MTTTTNQERDEAMRETDVEEAEEGGLLSMSDAAAIGFKVVEMADRLIDVDAAMPGTEASWTFEIDGHEYRVKLTKVRG
jgi:hypothetical protein